MAKIVAITELLEAMCPASYAVAPAANIPIRHGSEAYGALGRTTCLANSVTFRGGKTFVHAPDAAANFAYVLIGSALRTAYRNLRAFA